MSVPSSTFCVCVFFFLLFVVNTEVFFFFFAFSVFFFFCLFRLFSCRLFFFLFSLCVVVNRAPVSWGLCDGVSTYFSLAFLFWLYSLFFFFLFSTPSLVCFFFLPLFRFSCA